MWHAYYIEDVLIRIGQLGFERIAAQLWKLNEALNDWLYVLFENPYSGWQDAFDAFVDEQAAEGREIEPESKQAIVKFIEEHFASTQSESEIHGRLGRGGMHPSNQYLSYSLPPDVDLSDEDLVLAYDIALVVHRLRQAIREAKAALDKPSLVSQLNPFGEERLSTLQRLAEIKAAMSELELIFTLLGYDAIVWSRFKSSIDAGLEGALFHVPDAGPPHVMPNETIEILTNAASAVSVISLARTLVRRGVGLSLTRQVSNATVRSTKKSGTSKLTVQGYDELSKRTDLIGQAHHLNQSAAYRDVIAHSKGLSIKLEGNILKDADAAHTKAHRVLEVFWKSYRNTDTVPTNLEFTAALRRSLKEAGLSDEFVKEAVHAAIKERVHYNLLGGELVPRVPGTIRNLAQ